MTDPINPGTMVQADLGSHSRIITTSSAEAQSAFNHGLLWAYSFNLGEAERCFKVATEQDPSSAISFWGIALASGPNYNKAWKYFDQADFRASVERANNALLRASELSPNATPAEQGLINALAARFPSLESVPADLGILDQAYAEAMRHVFEEFPHDLDVAALFADALMCITPRGLWDLDTGKPTGSHTVEARSIIESALQQKRGSDHPALCHLYIHILEMSPVPELALPAADRLRKLVPDASHMLHMPTHIDAAVGDYRRSISSNNDAIMADDKYFSQTQGTIQYVGYRVHYICAKLYASMMSGRFTDAMSAAEKLEQVLDKKLLSVTSPPMADIVESFLGSRAHVLVRFGRWEDILELQLPNDRNLYAATTATVLYARGLAFGALGRIAEADEAQQQFELARKAVPVSRLNSIPCRQVDLLDVASAMLHGEIAYRKGQFDIAFAALRKATKLEDALPYGDPPPWMQPVRHALGGLLLEQNRVEEAEVAFRQDLGFAKGYPRRRAKLNNVWGLHGLHECFVRTGNSEDARFIQASYEIALAAADVPIVVSCYCRRSDAGVDEKTCC